LIGGVHVTTGGATGAAVETSGSGGKCIDIAEVNSANGTHVRIWNRTGGAGQKWKWTVASS
jgi:hypothetical protein